MLFISPTGRQPRGVDHFGSGAFHAPRGNRLHNGVDYECIPGQIVRAPISGTIVRKAYPYSDDVFYEGCVLENPEIQIKMFYFVPTCKIGSWVQQGEEIGYAQNISNKYSKGNKYMTPHVHLQIEYISPEMIRDTRRV